MSSENLAGYLGKATQIGREVITRIVAPDPFTIHTSTAVDETWQGDTEQELVEVLLIAGPENTEAIQFSLYTAVDLVNYLPLYAKDSIRFGGIKFSDIHLKFLADGDSIHIMKIAADGPMSGADRV